MKVSLLRVTGSVASIASSLVLFGGVASAQSTTNASISDTGNNSNNVITITDKCEIKITNNNNVNIVNNNTQVAASGNATVGGTDGGSELSTQTENGNSQGNGGRVSDVSTGDATNSNQATFNVSITNNPTVTCILNQNVPAPTPPAGGSGGGVPVVPVTPAVTQPVQAPAGGSGAVGATLHHEARQVAVVPQGGVGAGSGDQAFLGGLAAVTFLSTVWASKRLNRTLRLVA